MIVKWAGEAWADYRRWHDENRQVHKRINRLVEAIEADPFRGIGKPEALRHSLAGCWSRRITEEHRIVYKVTGQTVHILSCR
ncbi:MAG: hypothetical protein A2140_05855 [Candidatus Muproteobacteria bacterium RBG_16_62_13]|uniref:Putative mRNA interferase YoeB n=1 Tax=Candidatus Muproteobacteria bacterium RBG_16_62_13 TaxID=1817756 RepID=A0A1F6T804_9PROT|nr:MAG: hypothetical protein A2140_05855 [Candidatus Muproteobacteria bacterium RBG_16_62_13]